MWALLFQYLGVAGPKEAPLCRELGALIVTILVGHIGGGGGGPFEITALQGYRTKNYPKP